MELTSGETIVLIFLLLIVWHTFKIRLLLEETTSKLNNMSKDISNAVYEFHSMIGDDFIKDYVGGDFDDNPYYDDEDKPDPYDAEPSLSLALYKMNDELKKNLEK